MKTLAHELVLQGLPAAAMVKLFSTVLTLSSNLVLGAIGVSARSYARRKAAPKTRLPVDESERLWRVCGDPRIRDART